MNQKQSWEEKLRKNYSTPDGKVDCTTNKMELFIEILIQMEKEYLLRLSIWFGFICLVAFVGGFIDEALRYTGAPIHEFFFLRIVFIIVSLILFLTYKQH